MQDGKAPLVVPELLCPVPAAVSPYAARLDREVADWAAESGLCATPTARRRLVAARFGTLAARTCPEADPARLALYARWWAYGLVFTERFFTADRRAGTGPVDRTAGGHATPAERRSGTGDQRRAAADAVMATVSAFVPGGMRSGLPQAAEVRRLHRLDLLTELLDQTAEIARPEQLSRFGTGVNLCMSRRLTVNQSRSAETGFVSPYLTLSEIITESPATGAELADTDVARLAELATRRAAWCERLHSAVRRGSYRELTSRLPPLLRLGTEGCPQRALDRAARVHDEATRAHLRLEASVTATASPAVRHYLAMLGTWVRGHHDWCRDSLPRAHRPTTVPLRRPRSTTGTAAPASPDDLRFLLPATAPAFPQTPAPRIARGC
jgi:hypothetical protein